MGYFEVTHSATGTKGVFKGSTQRGAIYEAVNEWGRSICALGNEWTAVKVKAPKKAPEPSIMKTYYVIGEKRENDNTAEFGYGDYPRKTPYIMLTVEAETSRKAQNKAKKINPRLAFGGQFGNWLHTDADLPAYLRKTLR